MKEYHAAICHIWATGSPMDFAFGTNRCVFNDLGDAAAWVWIHARQDPERRMVYKIFEITDDGVILYDLKGNVREQQQLHASSRTH